MQRKSGVSIVVTTRLLLLLFISVFSGFFTENPYVVDANVDYSNGCDRLTCKIGEQCVNRKFWCNYSPCPSMSYCSRSRKESLKGPETCESVVCASGYKCLIRVRDCEWNQKCKQRAARCVTDREYYDGPASCEDVVCPVGQRCILKEARCYQPPCKLTKSCSRTRDVLMWFDKCKELGCRSEHECFLRRSSEKCTLQDCDHIPHCLSTNIFNDDEFTSTEHCRGWICPVNQECSAHVDGPCKHDNCHVTRTCHEPLLRKTNTTSDFEQTIDILSHRTTLTDLEQEMFREEPRKLYDFLRPTSNSNFTHLIKSAPRFTETIPTRISQPYKNRDYTTMKAKRVTAIPNMRSTSFGDSPWLTYLKQKASAEAVQYWIEKAKNNEDYEEFTEWLESVASLLDEDTYRLWLREVIHATYDIPEFQSWISPWNLEVYRSAHGDTDALEPLPGSIRDRSKNLFNTDRNLAGNSNSAYQKPFMEKQAGSSIVGTHPPGFEYHPFNFNFNEPKRFDEALGGINVPYLEIPHKMSAQEPGRRQQFPPGQDFGEFVKNSWKLWQSYYQFNPATSNFPGFPTQASLRDSYYLRNYTQLTEDLNPRITPPLDTLQRQPQTFFPNSENNMANSGTQLNFNQSPAETLNLYLTNPDDINSNVYREFNSSGYKMPTEDSTSMKLSPIFHQVSGLQQLIQLNPNIIKMDTNEKKPEKLVSSKDNEDDQPSLLIFVPPPLNFLIYYSATNQNASVHSTIKTVIENILHLIPLENVNFNYTKNKNNSDEHETSIRQNNLEINRGTDIINKQKELEYIRKIIKELISYWDEKEKAMGYSDKDEIKLNDSNIPVKGEKSFDEESTKLTVNKFLDWLTVNDQVPKKKNISTYDESRDTTKIKLLEDAKAISSKKVRILVDIEKHPELLKALFTKNNASNKSLSDLREYQIILNLDDVVDSKEENLISQKLIDIAKNQLHRNLSDNQKMPKILWVFPVYEDGENDTLPVEITKAINESVTWQKEANTAKPQTHISRYTMKSNNVHVPKINTGDKKANTTHNLKIDSTKSIDKIKEDSSKGNDDDYDDDNVKMDNIELLRQYLERNRGN